LDSCRGDAADIKRVIEELVENALYLSSETGRIEVRAVQESEGVSVSVEDMARGIEAVHLEHLFDPFYQGPSRPTLAKGTGLGLAVVQAIVQAAWFNSVCFRATSSKI